MSNRLDVTLFGTEYTVGMVRLNRDMIKAGMEAYGPKKWNRMVNDIVLDSKARKLADEVGHTIGYPLKMVYRQAGIVLQGWGFGMEVFWRGDFFPVDMVESRNRALQPTKVMQDYKRGEILGVFWARREGVMAYRWEEVEDLHQEDLTLSYDSLGPALARRRGFDIVTEVTLKGGKGKNRKHKPVSEFQVQKHVFHMKK